MPSPVPDPAQELRARRETFRAAYDAQLREEAEVVSALGWERHGPLVIAVYDGGQGFISYRSLAGIDTADLRDLIDEALASVEAIEVPEPVVEIEWKTRGHDAEQAGPTDGVHRLAELLTQAGFVAEQEESVMIGDARLLAADVSLPAGVVVRRAQTEDDVRRSVAFADSVFERSVPGMVEMLLRRLAADGAAGPGERCVDPLELWLAEADGRIIATGRLELVPGTQFAGIWGGCTDPAWRGRGVYRALTAARARVAIARGAAYIHSDCTPFSRPILERSGLVEVTTTTPYRRVRTAAQTPQET